MTSFQITADPLRSELVSLATLLTQRGIILTVGGGYGLVLKREYVMSRNLRTRFQDPPYVRSTNDVDLFLTADLIVDGETTRVIREALEVLGYVPVDRAKYFQFFKPIEYQGAKVNLKFDFLAPPVDDPTRVSMDNRRIRPRSYPGFHARVTPEALTIGELPTTLELGIDTQSAIVRLPHPFTYLLLKLHAFRDQVNNSDKDNGRHHAFDIYTTIALATEKEWHEMVDLNKRYADSAAGEAMQEACGKLFGTPTALGLVRLREYLQQAGLLIAPQRFGEFINDLKDLMNSNDVADFL